MFDSHFHFSVCLCSNVSSSVPWDPNVDGYTPLIWAKKIGTWRRTLPGRIHGGVHMRNCGVSSSIQSRCKAVGAEIHSSLVKRQLKNIQDRNDYHTTRTNSIKYKERQEFGDLNDSAIKKL
jgi:hypothetical protein